MAVSLTVSGRHSLNSGHFLAGYTHHHIFGTLQQHCTSQHCHAVCPECNVCHTTLSMHSLQQSAALAVKKRKEKTTPFGVNLMRSQVLYRAAQVRLQSLTAHERTYSTKRPSTVTNMFCNKFHWDNSSAPVLSGLVSECRRQGSWPLSAWSLTGKAGRVPHMLALALPAKQHIHSTQFSLQCCKLLPSSYINKQQHTIQHKSCRRDLLTSGSQI
jgi:hypothetical protein